jgi:hypothetical protein
MGVYKAVFFFGAAAQGAGPLPLYRALYSVNPNLIALSWSNTPLSILFLVIVLRGALLNRNSFLMILVILYQ